MGAAAEVFDGWRLWRSLSIAIGHVEDRSGVVQVGGHHLLFPGALGAEVGEVVADLRVGPSATGWLARAGRSRATGRSSPSGCSCKRRRIAWLARTRRAGGGPRTADMLPCTATTTATVGRHSTAMPSAAPHQAAASGRPSLRSSNQAPRLRKKVLAGCCHSA